MENQSMVAEKKNNWKTVGIILIVLAIILTAATGYLLWVYGDQKSQVDDLNNQVKQANKQIEQLKKTDNTTEEPADTGNNKVTETVSSYSDISKKLQAVDPHQMKPAGPIYIAYYNDGYVGAKAAYDDSWEFFYKTSQNGNWQYFTGMQNGFMCGQFKNNDLQKAFRSEQCYNGSDMSSVADHYGVSMQ